MSKRHRRLILNRNRARRAWKFAKILGNYFFPREPIDRAIAEAITELPQAGAWPRG